MELMRQSSKLAGFTRLETWVFTVKWQSNKTPRILTESDKGTDAQPTVKKSGKENEKSILSTRGYDHCFSLVVI